jgi:hypothetical protein
MQFVSRQFPTRQFRQGDLDFGRGEFDSHTVF